MKDILGYQILEHLFQSQGSVFVTGVQKDNRIPVIIKFPANPCDSGEIRENYSKEFLLAQSCHHHNVIQYLSLINNGSLPALILEGLEGIRLSDYLTGTDPDTNTILSFAVQMAKALRCIHQSGIIHRAFTPGSILVDPENQIKVFDFRDALEQSDAYRNTKEPHQSDHLSYIAPEQTGRMDREIDQRSDLYSLGVTLYEMLCNCLPFFSEDPMELIHSHLAKSPIPPTEINQDIPGVLSEITLKLLEKTPDNRYQTAEGLIHDLETCQQRLADSGEPVPFELADRDVPGRFLISDILMGRDREVRELAGIVKNADQDSGKIVLVSGVPGVGKTRFVFELQNNLEENKGLFVWGKFEQINRSIAYSGFISAIQAIVMEILSRPDNEIEYWQTQISAALENQGQVLTRIVPKLELIIGKQPEITHDKPQAIKFRLEILFRRLIEKIAADYSPLILFLDDLQWADQSSLDLFQAIAGKVKSLVLIGAYRDNEVSPNHPLSKVIGRIIDQGKKVKLFTLPRLQVENIDNLLKNTLGNAIEHHQILARLIHSKTAGNPFFVREFLLVLHDRKLLRLEECKGWSFDEAGISNLAVTDNVINLIAQNISDLPPQIRKLLSFIACMGVDARVGLLSVLMGTSLEETTRDVESAINRQILIKHGDILRFVHDKVQEAVYTSLSLQVKISRHYSIGLILLELHGQAEREESVSAIADHLNKGIGCLKSEQERYKSAELNLQAGREALEAGAWELALNYFQKGVENLPDEVWKTHYEMAYQLHLNMGDALYLTSSFGRAEKCYEFVQKKVNNKDRLIEVIVKRIILSTQQLKIQSAIGLLREAFRQLEYYLPKSREELRKSTEIEVSKTKKYHQEKGISALLNHQQLENPDIKLIINIISDSALTLYYNDPDLTKYCFFAAVNLSFEYGICEHTSYIISCCGMMYCGDLDDYQTGLEFAGVALKLADKTKKDFIKSKVYQMLGTLIYPWVRPYSFCLSILQEGFTLGMNSGEFVYAGISFGVQILVKFTAGEPLKSTIEYFNHFAQFLPEEGDFLPYMKLYKQMLLLFTSKSAYTGSLNSNDYNEAEELKQYETSAYKNFHYQFHRTKAMMSYWFGDFKNARKASHKAEGYCPGIRAHVSISEHLFYQSLIYLAGITDTGEGEKKKALNVVAKNQKLYKSWAEKCPENYSYKFLLVEAEKERVSPRQGSDRKAGELFNQAIESAGKHEVIHIMGLACELASRFYYSRKQNAIALLYLNEAWRCFIQWGATAKLKHMEEMYGGWWQPPIKNESAGVEVNGVSLSGSSESMDLATITKATRAISGEIGFEALLRSMMKIIIQSAGAEKGVLVFRNQKEFMIQAISQDSGFSVELFDNLSLEGSEQVCIPIIQYVIRSKEAVVLENATEQGAFTRCDYIRKNQPKSILCLPVRLKDEIMGVLYLENNLITHTFSENRIQVLNALVSQAAISLENAQLFEQEKKLVERMKEIDLLKDEFLANTSHELKTPLAGIIGLTESLLERLNATGNLSDVQDLKMIIRSGNRLSDLINDILDFSKLRHEDLKLQIRPLSLSNITDVVLRHCKPLAEHKDLFLINLVPENLPAVAADENRLQQILFNLLGNAIKFTAMGKIEINAGMEKNMIALSVVDSGMGIPAAELEKIFNLFEKGAGNIISRHGGTGLGLALTRKLVELHQGSIKVESVPGEGSCFTVLLPSHPGPPESLEFAKVARGAVMPEPGESDYQFSEVISDENEPGDCPHILIVDDDPVILRVLATSFAGSEYRISSAMSGSEALESIESEPDVDLVLLDVMMPGKNGYEVCRQLRTRYSATVLPVILMTARSRKEDVVAGFSAGANDYLTKPVTREELLVRVKTQLDLKQSIQRLKENESLLEEISRREEIEHRLESCQRKLIRVMDEQGLLSGHSRLLNQLSNMEDLLTEKGQELLSQARQIPGSLDEVPPSLSIKPNDRELKLLLVDILTQSLTYWTQTTSRSKLELAEASGLWTATLDSRGSYSTRTLDKYLNIKSLPKKPRWRNVIQTACFVVNNCPDTIPDLKKALQKKIQQAEILLLEIN
jgi:predicted ATPase/signal transduction histidine kinase/CheY-like chemotaxis protein